MDRILLILIALMIYLSIAVVIKAQSVDVVVVVSDVPEFVDGPGEVPESDLSTPTDEGDTLTISANVVDPASSDYYLVVCKSDQVIGNAGGQPTCPGGIWCVSGITPTGNDSSCDYSVTSEDEEANDWYAFACSSSTGFCSESSQGAGDSGSPFYVNHTPLITSISNNGDQDPGGTVTWSVEAQDPDLVGGNDSVKIYVCKSEDFENGSCTNATWCNSTLGLTNPSCSYQISDISKDKLENAFVYLIDNHGLVSGSELQGSNSPFSINNMVPQVSNLVLNNGNDIVLSSGANTRITASGTISDSNSCMGNEIKIVTASMYRSSIGFDNCNEAGEANDNYCYPDLICRLKQGESCTGDGDATLDFECEFDIEYFADPTDAGTQFSQDDWRVTIYAEDENGAANQREITNGVELNSLIAIDADNFVGYGSLNIGQTIDPVSVEIQVRSFSNVGLDAILYGTKMVYDDKYEIPVENQHYAVERVAFEQAKALTMESEEFELNLPKPTQESLSKNIYWGIRVPNDIPAGSYSGANYLLGVKGDIEGW